VISRNIFHCISAALIIVGIGASPAAYGQTNSIGFFSGGQYVKPAPGFFPDQNLHIIQRLDSTGPSRAAEYCHEIWGAAGCLMYIRTPTESKLIEPTGVTKWSVTDTDFNLKLKVPLRTRYLGSRIGLLPYLALGEGAIWLNGGTTSKQDPRKRGSGLNGQEDILAGTGFDWKWSNAVGIRVDVTVAGLEQTRFSDITYRSSPTDKIEIVTGLVHYWGYSKKAKRR